MVGISGKGRFGETEESVRSSATRSRSRMMAWKLIEVTDEGDETLSDWELIGVRIALDSAIGKSTFGAESPFLRILTKLAPQIAKACQRDQEPEDDLEKPKEN
jgi:hypothetical protein